MKDRTPTINTLQKNQKDKRQRTKRASAYVQAHYYTSEDLWNKMSCMEKKIEKLLERTLTNEIEEISLNKARKLLHCSSEKIMSYVRSGRLQAIRGFDKKGNERFRFTVRDIRKFQEERKKSEDYMRRTTESAASIAKMVFN